MTAECGTAVDHGPLAGLSFGLECTLFMLPTSLILREFGDGPVRFDCDMSNPLSPV